ncbi:hypothetical protein IAR50_002659 [Cryptococcus sp. DSM 104548]
MPLSDKLGTQEKLLLSQAIYKLGAFSWPQVSDLLLAHPCISKRRPKELFAPDRCEAMYKEMMASIGINVPTPDGMKPHTKSHLRLAQTHYIARMAELHAKIAEHESRFTALVTEVTSLKSGDLDDALRREIVQELETKYGKKVMEAWLQGEGKGKFLKAVEAGEVKEGEVDLEEEEKVKEKEEEERKAEEAKKAEKAAQAKEAEEAARAKAEAQEAAKQAEAVKGEVAADKAPESAIKEAKDVEMKDATPEAPVPPKEATPENKAARPAKTPEPAEVPSPAVSPLSPAPSDLSPIKPDPVPKRSHKRKAASQPRGAPAGKRSGRRGAAVAAEAEESEGEEDEKEEDHSEEEAENEDEQPVTRGRQGKRSSPAKPSLSPTKEGSPATSRRAPSVSSTNSATPGDERRSTRRGVASRRGKRDVSKPVRDQTTEREEEDNASVVGEDHEEPRKATRASRRKSGAVEAATPTPSATERRGTRSTAIKIRPRLGHRGVAESEPPQEGGDDEEVVKEEAPGRSTASAPRTAKRSSKPFLMALFEIILSHKFSNVFENPVRKSEAADYYDVIKKPMDLKSVKAGIKNGRIGSMDELERDVLLIFSNAMMYNAPGSQVYEMAKEMMKDCEGHFVHYRNMEMEMGGDGA